MWKNSVHKANMKAMSKYVSFLLFVAISKIPSVTAVGEPGDMPC
jgi:hypothetical protein